jgi:hypothetical protein
MRLVPCALLLLLCLTVPAAAVTLFVSPNGPDGFIIEGDNIGQDRIVEVHLSYDTAQLAGPNLEVQGATLSDLYDATPGTLFFVVDRGEEPAPVFEAHLRFRRIAEGSDGILSVAGQARDAQGKQSQAGSSLNLGTALRTEPPDDAGAAPEGDTGQGPGCDLDATLPGSDGAAGSVLRRFERYRGKRGVREFAELFARRDPRLSQEPAVALSDGKTPVKVTLTVTEQVPDLVLDDAKLVVVEKGEGGSLLVTLLPNAGSNGVSLLVMQGGELVELPLVVAAPLEVARAVGETAFMPALEAFQAEQARCCPECSPALNDYRFTANYLAGHPAAEVAKTAALPPSPRSEVPAEAASRPEAPQPPAR